MGIFHLLSICQPDVSLIISFNFLTVNKDAVFSFLIGDFRERFVKLLYLFKNKLLVALIFSIVFLVSISYISALIIMISFLLLSLGFFVLLSLIALGVRLGCLFEMFLVS